VARKTETEVGGSEEAEDSNMGIKVMYRFLAMTFCLLIEFVWCFFGLFSAAFVQITLKQHGSLVVFLSAAAAADAASFIRVVSHVPCFDRANIFFFGGVVQGLTKLLADNAPGAMKEQKFESYFGRRIAIDASMSIYQFLVRQNICGLAACFVASCLSKEKQALRKKF
jgi:hypothetical protein